MEAMLAAVDGAFIKALRMTGACRVADVGCGAGGGTMEIFRQAPAGSRVHGFDIAAASIDLARQRPGAKDPSIAFDVADMATAAPPPVRYDRLASRFGTMFFSDPPGAFANLRRWLAPGGRFAFAVWGRLADNPWMTLTRDTVAGVTRLPATDPAAPGPFRYADAEVLSGLLGQAGFSGLEVLDWRGKVAIGGGLPAEAAATFALASFSTFNEQLAQAGPGALQQAREALTARYAEHEQEGTVRLGAGVHIIAGGA
jgi:SAM-dependent methyltransferase